MLQSAQAKMQLATLFYAFAMLFVFAFAAPLEVRQETVSNVKCTSKKCVSLSHLPSPAR